MTDINTARKPFTNVTWADFPNGISASEGSEGVDAGLRVRDDSGTDPTHPLEVQVWRAEDGAIVVQLDTVEDTGRLRVNINDGTVFDDDPESAR